MAGLSSAGATRIIELIIAGDSAGAVKAIGEAGLAAEKTQSKFVKMQAAGRGMSSVGRTMTGLALPLVALGTYAVKSSMSYQQALTRLQTQTGASVTEVKKQAASIQGLNVGFNTTELAQGLYPIESVGLRGAKALDALSAAAKGAQIGGDTLTATTDALSGALGVGAKDIHSAAEAMMVMDKTVGLGKMHLEDLTAAMGTGVLQEAKNVGLGFRDVGAALAAMTRQGVPADVAASRMRLTLTKMAAPTGAALKALQSVGLTQTSLADDLRGPKGLIGALLDLRGHLQGLSQDRQTQVLSAAFGQSRGLANVAGLLNALPGMTGIRSQLGGASAGQFAKKWGEQLKTPAQQFKDMMAKMQTSVTNLGTAIMPIVLTILPKLARLIEGAVKWLSHLPKPVKDIVVGFTLFLAIGGPILMFLGSVVTAIGTLGAALKALTTIEVASSTVMKATIFGFIIFALVMLITHFKQVRKIAIEVWSAMKTAVSDAARAIGSVATTIWNALTWPFRKAWQFIKGVFHGIKSLASGIISGAGSVLSDVTFGVLHSGGEVRAKHFAAGGPVGTDTIPGWLSPGEGVLTHVGMGGVGGAAGLNRLNAGGGGLGNVTIEAAPIVLKLDGRTLAEGVVRYVLKKNARGPSSLTGGGLLTGSVHP